MNRSGVDKVVAIQDAIHRYVHAHPKAADSAVGIRTWSLDAPLKDPS